MFSTVKEYGSMIDREYTSPSGESLFYENLMITYSMPMLRENKPEKE
jgi:DNA polymerase/3'-5' exonuclease PolX